ncbi:SLC13 family permease [Desulfatitalea tepidiphila]|uniref:SLC13 family permease n=1 Tax=Desulfatitalea tepidiphila TaxID=1185843 RepID=UPI0006B64A91|nr:SLC13 family permease [Desulfatitalea tepidiphila]
MLTMTRIKWLISLAIPVAIYFAVDPTVHPKMPLFFAFTAWAVTVWALEILPAIPVAAALTFFYVLGEVAPAKVVYAPWSSFLPWLCLAALVLGDALEHTGLTRRMALRLMLLVGATYRNTIIALMATGIFMAFLLPDIMCRVIIFVAIAHGLVLALDLKPTSRISSAIIMAGFFSATSPGYGFLTGTEMALITASIATPVIGPVSWGEFALANLPFNLLYCAMSVVLCVYVIPGKEHLPQEDHLKEVIHKRLAEMGPMTATEWRLLAVLIVAITGLLTQKFHGMPGTFVYAMVGLTCYLPVLNISKPENFRHLNVGFIIFIVACLGIGAVAQFIGADKWMASLVLPVMQKLPPSLSVLAAYCTSAAVNFILTPLAAVSSLTAPMIEIAQALGINPKPMLFAFLNGLDQYIFPYEYALYMYAFTTGYITARHIMKGLALRMFFTGVGIIAIQVPYWRFIGIL